MGEEISATDLEKHLESMLDIRQRTRPRRGIHKQGKFPTLRNNSSSTDSPPMRPKAKRRNRELRLDVTFNQKTEKEQTHETMGRKKALRKGRKSQRGEQVADRLAGKYEKKQNSLRERNRAKHDEW